MKKKALVTGCCGFIGSNLVHELVRSGWAVEGVDDMSNGHMEFLTGLDVRYVHVETLHLYHDSQENKDKDKDVIVIQGDFAHKELLSRIKTGRYDVIFHLAANPRVEYSVERPVETTEVNVLKTVGLFHSAVGNVDKIVFSSSSSVYGDTERLPTRESQSTSPQSPYALQKHVCEEYAALFLSLYDLEIVSLRYFNVYGPRQYGNSPYSTAISAWCHKINESMPLRSDGNGEQTRDMVYVDDVVNANILAASAPKVSTSGRVFNIATGKSFSNNQIMSMFLENFGELEIEHAAARKGDVRHTLADITNANNFLQYKPKTSLKDGLEKTWKWWGLI